MRTNEEFVKTIDATLLLPNATESDIRQHLLTARKYGFKTVAIGCAWFPVACEVLADSEVGIDAPIGFPSGYTTTECKVFETIDAFAKGAAEADMLINIGWLRSGRYDDIAEEIRRFVAAAGGRVTKVILETSYLSDEEKIQGVRLVKRGGADFVKTSTGFTSSGATESDIRLMMREAGDSLQVKASGGIRNREFAEKLLDLGATRLGASHPERLLSF
ncbi:MAG: deoxyribose-phosphate aldolase [Eubacteriales bacterium]|nr:deoxyribose-phosphate aldolase [Eubacteriales bacterium]